MRLVEFFVVAIVGCAAGSRGQNCSSTRSVCLATAYRTLSGVTDPTACCAACAADGACLHWHINAQRSDCFLHKTYQPNGRALASCTAGNVSAHPSPAPTPMPGPLAGLDLRPRFHFQPQHDPTNDVQGPFYDPRHRRYHMGYAWHVLANGSRSAPNRWEHLVSDDLARWRRVSTTPDLAWLKPREGHQQQTDKVKLGMETAGGAPTHGPGLLY